MADLGLKVAGLVRTNHCLKNPRCWFSILVDHATPTLASRGAYDVAIGAENILSMERFLRDPVGFSYASLKIKSVDHRFIWRGEFILQYSVSSLINSKIMRFMPGLDF